ncbi:hypothetical protein D9611_007039 [Ephemerocybe angulata]|uniref:Uncharacterized protein n=1 Tax=Ephemerocybe angulata TaxID=980116 RepID=A0A8H5B120_9AGAR|nr:hypothetical protein D9611_007039 [Tulosesus angulatus]
MIIGTKPRVSPRFHFGVTPTAIVKEKVYVGFTVSDSPGALLREHYEVKAAKAKAVGGAICGVEQLTGTLPTKRAVQLYMACVDPHLTHGSEVMLDTNKSARKELESVQKGWLRRIMGVGKRSVVAALHTETGVEPIGCRRVLLAIGYLRHMATQCRPEQLVRRALVEAIELDWLGYNSWVSDLRSVVTDLPGQVQFPDHRKLLTAEAIEDLEGQVKKSMTEGIQREMDQSRKLILLHGRCEPDEEGNLVNHVPLKLRHYMLVCDARHRRALTRVLVSNHKYGVELLGYGKGAVERARRLCRFCRVEVETPEHIWLRCEAKPQLIVMRAEFTEELLAVATEGEREMIEALNSDDLRLMKYVVSMRSAVALVVGW